MPDSIPICLKVIGASTIAIGVLSCLYLTSSPSSNYNSKDVNNISVKELNNNNEDIQVKNNTVCNNNDNNNNCTDKNVKVVSSISTISRSIKTEGLGVSLSTMALPEFNGCIYLDYNATTPVYPEVALSMIPYITKYFGNPSSSHAFSRSCKESIKISRSNIGNMINCNDFEKEIIFTSCGTESDNRAIDIALYHYSINNNNNNNNLLPHIVSSVIEHPAILVYLKYLESIKSITYSLVPVDNCGFVNIKDVANALTSNTALVTIMHSNNEVGTIQPIRAIGRSIQTYNNKNKLNILFHTDAAQSIGKVVINVQELGVDMLTIVGHKFGAPKGIAALYVHDGIRISPMLHGGGQEHGIRSGTECIPLIVALGTASRLVYEESNELLLHMLTLKLRLITGLKSYFDDEFMKFNGPIRSNDANNISSDLKILRMILKKSSPVPSLKTESSECCSTDNGHDHDHSHSHSHDHDHNEHKNNSNSCGGGDMKSNSEGCCQDNKEAIPKKVINNNKNNNNSNDMLEQLPNTISVSFKNISSHDKLIPVLSDSVACSAGSACHASLPSMSAVLSSMSVHPDYGLGTLRISIGRHTTADEIDKAIKCISSAVIEARKLII